MKPSASERSCANCVYFCGVYSPKTSTEYHSYVCVVEHFFALQKDVGAKQRALTVKPSSLCEMHTMKLEFDNVEILKW
jgi:hypothetical protein